MIYLGADHRGLELKNEIKGFLGVLGYDYEDFGAFGLNQEDDYPDFARPVAEKVSVDPVSRGILICIWRQNPLDFSSTFSIIDTYLLKP